MSVRTLPKEIQHLWNSAPVVTSTMEVANEMRALSRVPISYVKDQAARRLTGLIAEVADFHEEPERDHGFRGDSTRYTMKVIAMKPAELAVLLARAYEIGARA
ncbi:hypothetical protein [Variovorax sp. V15]|uniref:hypothetical protein n=1 Tax=Variovorax sp. V15 TaxID=3065952 RepID=UPI0034E8C197